MKTGIAVLASLQAAAAFTASSTCPPVAVARPTAVVVTRTSSSRLYLDSRINEKIDLESAKVATMETLSVPSKKVFCRCWQSGTFPLCDGMLIPRS
jgi:CDGSH-type Zn-finger protein